MIERMGTSQRFATFQNQVNVYAIELELQ